MKKTLHIVFLLICSYSCIEGNNTELKSGKLNHDLNIRPKLVVGIVVDQMRYDYLTRFYSKYGDGGFKRLVNEGFNCKNNHFNYIPTKTGPGHASIFTGTTPKYHGIIANDWFDKNLKHNVYCAGDGAVQSVGTSTEAGQMSPHRMLTTTFTDENRLFTQMRGKTIGISIKDRGSILPAGHTANASYWFYGKDEGNWITSTFYMSELPDWVRTFNSSDATEKYLKEWNTLYDINTYVESGADLNTYEGGFEGKETATFPYDLDTLKDLNEGFDIVPESPYGNSLTSDFAIAAIDAEQLGQDDITDVLTVSYSSTDKVGHNFGVNSKEIQDTYLRLDKDLERLLNALDAKVGSGEYTVFLTADHGAPYVPYYLKSRRIPAGLFDLNQMRADINNDLEKQYNATKLILSTINNQIFLDHDKIINSKLDAKEIGEVIVNKLLKYELIDKVFISSEINRKENLGDQEMMLNNGYNQKRSGDIMILFNPSVFKDVEWNRTGTDHGTGFNYDTHVPLLFYGKGIKHGSTLQRTEITDIAPTISALLGISFPNGATGKPLEKVLH